MIRRLALSALALLTFVPASGCAKPTNQRYAPYFDAVFEQVSTVRTRDTDIVTLEVSDPLISDINSEDYTFDEVRMVRNAELNDEGDIISGELMVLDLQVLDRDGVSLSDSFGRNISLRLMIADDWTITKGSLTGEPNNVTSLWKGMTGGAFQKGACRMMYLDDNVAIGQFSAEFEAFHIHGSFRTLVNFR